MFDSIGRLVIIGVFLYMMVVKRQNTIKQMKNSKAFTIRMIALYLASIASVLWW